MKRNSTTHRSFNKVFDEPTHPEILTSDAGQSPSWQFILAKEGELPPPSLLSSATFCIVTYRKRLLLIERPGRGAEFPGGEIHEDEDVLSAVKRTTLEEAGSVIFNPIFFGYKKLSASKPSYIPYFYAEAKGMFYAPGSEEVHSVHLVTGEDAKRLLATEQKNAVILQYLVKKKLIDIK